MSNNIIRKADVTLEEQKSLVCFNMAMRKYE